MAPKGIMEGLYYSLVMGMMFILVFLYSLGGYDGRCIYELLKSTDINDSIIISLIYVINIKIILLLRFELNR